MNHKEAWETLKEAMEIAIKESEIPAKKEYSEMILKYMDTVENCCIEGNEKMEEKRCDNVNAGMAEPSSSELMEKVKRTEEYEGQIEWLHNECERQYKLKEIAEKKLEIVFDSIMDKKEIEWLRKELEERDKQTGEAWKIVWELREKLEKYEPSEKMCCPEPITPSGY